MHVGRCVRAVVGELNVVSEVLALRDRADRASHREAQLRRRPIAGIEVDNDFAWLGSAPGARDVEPSSLFEVADGEGSEGWAGKEQGSGEACPRRHWPARRTRRIRSSTRDGIAVAVEVGRGCEADVAVAIERDGRPESTGAIARKEDDVVAAGVGLIADDEVHEAVAVEIADSAERIERRRAGSPAARRNHRCHRPRYTTTPSTARAATSGLPSLLKSSTMTFDTVVVVPNPTGDWNVPLPLPSSTVTRAPLPLPPSTMSTLPSRLKSPSGGRTGGRDGNGRPEREPAEAVAEHDPYLRRDLTHDNDVGVAVVVHIGGPHCARHAWEGIGMGAPKYRRHRRAAPRSSVVPPE